jgi:TPR repeat protein
MRNIQKAGWLALATGMIFGAGCADKANIVRPGQQNIGAALGEGGKCTPESLKDPNGTDRFVVEWNDGDRATLEAEMSRGVALVKFTCDGIKVLRSCAVPGEYEYNAASKKTRSLQITDAASASANLSTPTPGANFKAAMEQGKALNLAYVMVGSLMTTVQDVTRAQITRDACREATHFVFKSEVGAFAIAAGERGKAMAAAEVLRYGGASAEMSSERQALSSDGDSEACQQATAKDSEPPQDCRAMMRISIIPLVEGKLDATVVASTKPEEGEAAQAAPTASADTRTCPAGLVFDGDLCVKPAQADNFLCAQGDLAGCEQQCKKGSPASCGRLVPAFFKKHNIIGYLLSADFSGDGKKIDALKGAAPLLPLLKAACLDEDEGAACTMGAMIIGAQRGKSTQPDDGAQAREMIELMTTGCEAGNATACSFIVGVYGETNLESLGIQGDASQLDEIVGAGCDTGSASACMELGSFFYQGTLLALGDSEVEPDYPKAARYTAKACYGGVGEACFWSAMMYATSEPTVCRALLDQHAAPDAPGIADLFSLSWPTLTGDARDKSLTAFCENTSSIHDAQKALGLAQKACHISSGDLVSNACSLASSLK